MGVGGWGSLLYRVGSALHADLASTTADAIYRQLGQHAVLTLPHRRARRSHAPTRCNKVGTHYRPYLETGGKAAAHTPAPLTPYCP